MSANIKDTPYFALYGEIYRLHGKYIESVADDCFWSALTIDADTLYKKYKDTPKESLDLMRPGPLDLDPLEKKEPGLRGRVLGQVKLLYLYFFNTASLADEE